MAEKYIPNGSGSICPLCKTVSSHSGVRAGIHHLSLVLGRKRSKRRKQATGSADLLSFNGFAAFTEHAFMGRGMEEQSTRRTCPCRSTNAPAGRCHHPVPNNHRFGNTDSTQCRNTGFGAFCLFSLLPEGKERYSLLLLLHAP